MGAVCVKGTSERKTETGGKVSGFSGKLRSINSVDKSKDVRVSNSTGKNHKRTPSRYDSGEPPLAFSRELKPSTPARKEAGKVKHNGSFFGRAGIIGLEKAVDVLDSLGSSMSNLNANNSFVSGVLARGNKISILAFEVANTIVKGANLLQSLSEENVHYMKKEVFHSEVVQQLVTADMKEFLSFAAADKREELDVFSREIVRFGNLCKDPQWHNLDRLFSRLDSENLGQKLPRGEAEMTMQELTHLAQNTSELYHELHALDRFEQDYAQKQDEVEALNLSRRGEGILMLENELKHQKRLVRNLKKKSLWYKSLEDIMEKLVDSVTYIYQAIQEAFGDDAMTTLSDSPQRLGKAGLALHYANLVTQIDNIASRPASLPPNTRDTLYHGLPANVKKALHSRLQAVDAKEELSVGQVKAEMEKTLEWLVPVATDTIKAHQGFGWVGEWATNGTDFGKNKSSNSSVIRLQTFYHAEMQKSDLIILELLTWLHRLIDLVRHRDYHFRPHPIQTPLGKGKVYTPKMDQMSYFDTKPKKTELSQEDRNLINEACRRKLVPGISKSQELSTVKRRRSKVFALSRSMGSSPTRGFGSRRSSEGLNISFLDVMDGLGSKF